MERLGVAPIRTVVVGDHPVDVGMATAAGCGAALGILTGLADENAFKDAPSASCFTRWAASPPPASIFLSRRCANGTGRRIGWWVVSRWHPADGLSAVLRCAWWGFSFVAGPACPRSASSPKKQTGKRSRNSISSKGLESPFLRSNEFLLCSGSSIW